MSTYGNQIKTTRAALNLLQKDLSDSGISRAHIADLESGKSKLVAIKALRLYEKFIYYSLLKNVKIDLFFDDLFKSDSEYFIFKQCYNDIWSFKSSSEVIDETKINNLINKYKNKDIKKLKFFLLSVTGLNLLKINKLKDSYGYLLDALISLKYDLTLLNIDAYEDTLEIFQKVSHKLEKGNDVVAFYKDIINYRDSNNLQLRKYTYFNVSLFEKLSYNYGSSLYYLDKHIHLYPKMSIEDKFDFQITRASLLMKLGDFNNAINTYLLLTDAIDINKFPKRLSIVCSNAINFIVKNKIPDQNNLLELCYQLIEKLLISNPEMFSSRYKVFSNLGQVHLYEGSYTESKSYFNKAFIEFKKTQLDKGYNYLELIMESYETYKKNDALNELVYKFITIDKSALNQKSTLLSLKVLSKILFDYNLIEDNLMIELKAQFL